MPARELVVLFREFLVIRILAGLFVFGDFLGMMLGMIFMNANSPSGQSTVS